MKPFSLFFFLLFLLRFSHAQNAPLPAPNAASKPVARPKMPTFEESMTKARKLKAARDYKGAKNALYDAMDANWKDARPGYLLAWIAVAQNDRKMAIYNFRAALRDGLKGRDAIEARAALKRMGASEKFPAYKRPKISAAQRFGYSMLAADLFKPTTAEWAVQTAIMLAIAALGWALTMGAVSLAAKEKFGAFDLKTIAFWCAILLLLRVAGQFVVSYRHVIPLVLAYAALSAGQFLAALFYGARRLLTKKVMDKGGIVAWGSFYTLLFLVFAGGSTFLGPYFIALAVLGLGLWMLFNPWYFASQRAEKRKNKGDLEGAVALMEAALLKPRLSRKSRFVMFNDLASNYLLLNQPEISIERATQALLYVDAFKSAEVLPRTNLAEAFAMQGRTEEAIDQLSQVWHLTETADCIMSNALWQGTTHGMLANINYWRGWIDEAERQADLCLEAFPAEQRAGVTAKNLVAMSRAIKGAARMAAGDLETAHKYLAAAPKTGPKRSALAFVHFVASQVHEASGNLPEAEKFANAALEASSSHFPAQIQLASLLNARGERAEAIEILQKALLANTDHHLAPFARQQLRGLGGSVPAELEAPGEIHPRPLLEKITV
ncbi:MAG TPA: hypothetical protein VGB45_13045 [Abditibacterium sp.]|jgi:tetratricopeptide (TPR) repeat protein